MADYYVVLVCTGYLNYYRKKKYSIYHKTMILMLYWNKWKELIKNNLACLNLENVRTLFSLESRNVNCVVIRSPVYVKTN